MEAPVQARAASTKLPKHRVGYARWATCSALPIACAWPPGERHEGRGGRVRSAADRKNLAATNKPARRAVLYGSGPGACRDGRCQVRRRVRVPAGAPFAHCRTVLSSRTRLCWVSRRSNATLTKTAQRCRVGLGLARRARRKRLPPPRRRSRARLAACPPMCPGDGWRLSPARSVWPAKAFRVSGRWVRSKHRHGDCIYRHEPGQQIQQEHYHPAPGRSGPQLLVPDPDQ